MTSVNAAAFVERCGSTSRLRAAHETLGTVPGQRDELVATLTRHNEVLRGLGCSLYEVGVHADAPDTVFVVEVWQSPEAHRHSLENAQVQAAIAAPRPILSGEFGGTGSTS